MYSNGFVLAEDVFLRPKYSISPFRSEDVTKNKKLLDNDNIDKYLENKFQSCKYVFTKSGRAAISCALELLGINKDDCVTIFTTSNNFYVSSCVTNEIKKNCLWSRKIEKNTRVIFVIHEFGFPYEKLSELRKYNLPIIEDCAHSFASQNAENTVGLIGNFVIYSLPKFFPIQFGGILKTNTKINLPDSITNNEKIYIRKVLSNEVCRIDSIIRKRRENYTYLKNKLLDFGCTERFNLEKSVCPGVYLFRINVSDLANLKTFMQSYGVECSVFYKEDTFFLPINQRMNYDDLDYIIEVLNYFIKKM